MFRLLQEDLPDGWTVLRSPIDKRRTRSLDELLPGAGGPPAAWHEIATDGGHSRVLLRIVDLTDEPVDSMWPFIHSVLVTPGVIMSGTNVFKSSVTATDLRDVPLEEIDRAISARWYGESRVEWLRKEIGWGADEPLRRPDAGNRDTFSARVALAYLTALSTTSNPTKAIADQADVPHATAQRWVVTARKDGYLPPARAGRAG
jgi:hypothetical protein